MVTADNHGDVRSPCFDGYRRLTNGNVSTRGECVDINAGHF
jgi:hypothetical protein